ncbi:MAG: ABC transporter permease [Bryobacterales bacterium]|nr:ABC transporter permease [Bryobacterales bacterium]
MELQIVRAIAAQEFRVHIRSKWTVLFGLIFAVLSLGIAYFGMITSGLVGFQNFTRTSASLLNLVIYIVPLMSLTMGALSFTPDSGAAELLFSQPIERREILLGKVCGLFASVATATCFGFGAAGIVISLNGGSGGMAGYVALITLTLLLALDFLSLGTLVAVLAKKRTHAFGYALAVWFFFILFYDLLVMGGALLLREHSANLLIFSSLFGNPASMVRVAVLIALGGSTIFGAAGAMLLKFVGGTLAGISLLVLTLVVWTAAPLFAAGRLLEKQDI